MRYLLRGYSARAHSPLYLMSLLALHSRASVGSPKAAISYRSFVILFFSQGFEDIRRYEPIIPVHKLSQGNEASERDGTTWAIELLN